jgi:hypothetical protein
MVNIFQNVFYKDFFYPIILPSIIVFFAMLGVYIGSRYYYSDIENKLVLLRNNVNTTYIDHINRLSKIHYYTNIVFITTHCILVAILTMTIIFYMITGREMLRISYYTQLRLAILLFSINTFLSLAVPDVEVSLIESYYIGYIKNNMTNFFFQRLTPMLILITYSLIFIRYNINGVKNISSSRWHQVAILIITVFLFVRDIFFITDAFKNLKEINNYSFKNPLTNKFSS